MTALQVVVTASLDSPSGRMVRDIVIPVISRLRAQFPLPISLLTSPGHLADIGANNASLCGDLALSDGFFDNLKLK